MADKAALARQYSYSANSNLVLAPTERSKPDASGSGEPETLRGKELSKFGDRAHFSKPPIEKSNKRKVKRKADEKSKKKKFEHESVLSAAKTLLESSTYRPKTEETRAAFESLLNFVQTYLGDQPQDILRGAADEALSILKDDRMKDMERKREIEKMLGTISNEKFTNLVNIGKSITDYSAEDAAVPIGQTLDDELGVAVVFDEEEEDSDLDVIEDEDEEDEEGEETTIDAALASKNLATSVEEKDQKDFVDARSIDAFWLQREVSKYYKEATDSQRMAAEVLEAMSSDESEREIENQLVILLDFDKFDLVKKLMKNRLKIVYCTKLARAHNDAERSAIENEMRDDPKLRPIIDELERTTKTAATIEKGATGKRESKADRMEVDEPEDRAPSDVNRARNILDLESLTFESGGHFMASKTCELPAGSYRTQKKGYEEVHVPGVKPKELGAGEKLIRIASDMPQWARAGFKGMKQLNRVQSRVYETALLSHENMLLCAPTGAGKTNVAMLAILREIGKHIHEDGSVDLEKFKVVYVAPMKALVQEVVGNLTNRLEEYKINVRELTGDVQMTKQQIHDTQIIVTTPEKWDIVTRKSGERTFTQHVKLIIIDEIHLLHDDRGPVLESIVARTIRQIETTQEMVRIVGLSATLPNYEDVAAFLRVKPERGLFHFDNSYRPVSLQQQYIGITERKALKRMQLMNEITYEKVMEQAGKNQVLIFVHSRKETAKTARSIRDLALENDTLAKFLGEYSASREILQTEAESVKNADLKDLLPYGFAIHHAGMTRADRTLVEDLFSDRHVQVLVSTATLAWGVNLPAHTVIIKGTQIYNPEKGRWTELSPLDVMQMMGRAGRPQFEKTGEGIIITTHTELQFYLSLLNQQLPIESQYIGRLADNLNAEIVLGTVQNIREAVNWLGYTYLYVRMLRNPQLYGISMSEIEADPLLEQRRYDLIHSAATLLDKKNILKYDRKTGSFQVTDLGVVASHYYVAHQSISTFNEHLKPTMSDIELFRLFSLSSEFKYMTVREEEKIELQKLIERVPVPVKETIEEPSAKVNVLLQSYISQLKLEGFALVSDMVYVTQSAGRIVRALFEIVLKRGWANLAHKCLQLAKMIDRRMWSSQSPLRQFKSVPEDIVKQFERIEVSWERLYDLTPAELGELVRFPKMGKAIYKYIHQFPRLDLTAHVQPITRSVLRIDLTITPDFQYDDKIHGGAQAFWITVEDVDGERILHYESFVLKAKFAEDEHHVSFTVPIFEPLPPQYFIRIVSDRWLSSETVLPVSFRHLILPEKYPPHTELLDLQPLPVSGLRHEEYMKLYSEFTHFNPIQTQVFNTLYNTNDNALVAAPTGSGKTICAEFAILRMFSQHQDASRCVYVAPLQAIATQRYNDWKIKFGQLGKRVVELTGETSADLKLLEQGQIIVTTAERWDIISRRWKVRKNVQNVKLFIVDELHLIGGNNGPTLEVIVSRMRMISSQIENSIRIVALSSSLANARDLGEWIGATSHSLYNFHPNVRPVPLEILIQGFESTSFSARMLAMSKPTFQAIKKLPADKPAIVFVPSRKYVRIFAFDLLTYIIGEGLEKRFIEVTDADLEPYMKRIKNKDLQHLLSYGIGIYHDGMLEDEIEIVEKLYNSGAIRLLVGTYSSCWSMNATAHLIVIAGTQYYDGKEHHYADYPITDMLQMMGRASRPLIDDSGKCAIFCHAPKKDFYKKFLYEPYPVESHLDRFLADHMNAEIVTKVVTSKQDAVDYLTWTFLYRRLRQNPNYYSLHGVTHRHLSDYLSELVENTLEDLSSSKCIAIEEDNDLTPLNLGMIAAYYYIQYTTIELFNSSLVASTKLKGLIEILSSATEFADMAMRQKEDGILRKMAMYSPLKLEKPKYTDPATKVNVLMQAHFSRTKLGSDLEKDKAYILENCVRLIQAIVDVISSNGWLNPALAAMELSQMAVQAMWDKDSPLMQLPYFDAELVKKCTDASVESVFDLIDLEEDDRKSLLASLSPAQLQDVARACNRYPSIDVSYEVANADEITPGASVTVNVNLDREIEEDERLGPVHAPFFPKEKEEAWWVVIGDPSKNQLFSIKRVVFGKRSRVRLELPAPQQAGSHSMKMFLMCDSYIGCDQEFDLNIDVKPEEEDEGDQQMEDEENADNEMKE